VSAVADDRPRFPTTVAEAAAEQQRLRPRLVLAPPPGFAPRTAGGFDVSMTRGSDVGYAGIAVLDLATHATVATATAVAPLPMPYVPGFLSFRELPVVVGVWEALAAQGVRPDVLIFDGQGYAHPRRFGIACHGGVLFDVPSIGCAKSILVGRHEPLGPERGARAPLVHRGEVVGMAVRLRANVHPMYVSPGHRMDLDTAVAIVEALGAGFREPETTRRAHALVNAARRRAEGGAR
jgi:deoxyribonuclease V